MIEGGAIRDLAKDLRDASDSAILRVTGMIDRLPERGASDRLLDGLRPRLCALRPPRPLNFSRALFMPLDAVIVPPNQWHVSDGTIPRSLIAPVAALVESQYPELPSLQAMLAAGKLPQAAFWRQAAEILSASPMPDSWRAAEFQTSTGIAPQALTPLLAAIRVVFAHVGLFRANGRSATLGAPAWHESAWRAPAVQSLRPLLLAAARSGPTTWSVVLTLLFEQSTEPAALVETVTAVTAETRLAAPLGDGLRRVIGAVIDKLDQAAPQPSPGSVLSDAALDAQSLRAARLAGFSALRGEMVGFARSLTARRQEMASECAAQLADGLNSAPTACAASGEAASCMPGTPEERQGAAERLESRLKALRRLDLAARPLGEAQTHETLLAQAAAFYCGNDGPAWLERGDRLRLCEILVGAEAALRLAGMS
ncbi:hypothetical protein [Lichenicoccus sp.]|uniref:hypothetical protein n=1 Tax=Lichenicoccus sp. TaxID=2781899 RepID=UPI003D10320C